MTEQFKSPQQAIAEPLKEALRRVVSIQPWRLRLNAQTESESLHARLIGSLYTQLEELGEVQSAREIIDSVKESRQFLPLTLDELHQFRK